MKKIYLCILLVLTFILTGCSSSNLSKISLDELNNKLDSKETFILYFASENNNALEKTLVEVLEENNLTAYKVDTNKISDEERLKLQTSIDYKDPSIVFIIKGKDPSVLAHVTNSDNKKEDIINRLKDMNFIQE